LDFEDQIQRNQIHWDEISSIHFASPYYNVERFKAGNTSLLPIELEELGDIAKKSLLHLQCHFGLDTLSLARLGAEVTGIDLSPKAIHLANELSQELQIPSRFLAMNLYDLDNLLPETFDIVFTSYGAINWLPDLNQWAKSIASHLYDGGIFYIVEIHPFSNVLSADEPEKFEYDYFSTKRPYEQFTEVSYAEEKIPPNAQKYYWWQHSLGEVISSLIESGLTIDYLHEFPLACYREFSILEKQEDGYWHFPEGMKQFPCLFSLKAQKNSSPQLNTHRDRV
jgi:2-polyprenyl-3-methyl-5-hydroxy-6-metoxy-1,4-benzoquinol methylase